MAAVDFIGIRLDADDVLRVSTFWADLLSWKLQDRADGAAVVVPNTSSSYPLAVCPAGTSKNSQNRLHFDLTTGGHTGLGL